MDDSTEENFLDDFHDTDLIKVFIYIIIYLL